MKVLLSAYACEPCKGSEPGVGWHWAIEIARRGHQVTVLTRANNRADIEAARALDPDFPTKLAFVYYDLPAFACALKRRFNIVLPYYAFWQWGAYRIARRLHTEGGFDIVHHITFGTIRHYSFMGQLGIPFILGPIGGGETSPFWLRWRVSWRGGVIDTIRDFYNFLSRFDPISRRASRDAVAIGVRTPETLRMLPRQAQQKALPFAEIGLDCAAGGRQGSRADDRCKRILFVGRFLYWKGMKLGLCAFARALSADPSLSLTLLGRGPEERRWRSLAAQLGIADHITWISWVPQPEVQKYYLSHGLLLFPSLHDSGGTVLLEALAHGLPAVCLKLGGPGQIVDDQCGRAVLSDHADFDRLIDDLAQTIREFTGTPERWMAASARARAAATKWTWSARVNQFRVY